LVAVASDRLYLAVALEGAGWHPAAWREPSARPSELFDARYWVDLVREAEEGFIDFVTFEDSMGLQSASLTGLDDRIDQVRGRLDAVLVAARVAPLTTHIGLVPTATMTHTEPFHVSKAIATLDFVSHGRAGWRAQLSRPHEDSLFGRRHASAEQAVGERFDEASEFVDVVRRLWDSWEDDAEIRDVGTGRFVDREKLHYIDFEGKGFSVRGPSIVPRPPQGQPIVTALAHSEIPYHFAAVAADVVYVTPNLLSDVAPIVAAIEHERAIAGRLDRIHVFGDLVVLLDEASTAAQARRERLDTLAGYPYRSDAAIYTGTPAELAEALVASQMAGLTGFRLRPATIPHDLEMITRVLVPELQRRGVFGYRYEEETLRARLGLPRPANRYVKA